MTITVKPLISQTFLQIFKSDLYTKRKREIRAGCDINGDILYRFAVAAVAVVAAVDETIFTFGAGAVVGAVLGGVPIRAIGGVIK